MTTEKKKALLADVRDAGRALGRVLDGGHDLSHFSPAYVTTLREQSLGAMAGLSLLEAKLTAEIGTDNL
ncbi:MAG TPA: hypothetical protein VG168_06265 [Bryobacteraceae bacterium]|jgi:hypothetical protein|nr:hypothetical protein [Bryobacteraceae bacterium]